MVNKSDLMSSSRSFVGRSGSARSTHSNRSNRSNRSNKESGSQFRSHANGHHFDDDDVMPPEKTNDAILTDADGNDVTPRSLANPSTRSQPEELQSMQGHDEKLGSFGAKSVNMMSTMLLGRGRGTNFSFQTSTNNPNDTMAIPFSRSMMQSSMASALPVSDNSRKARPVHSGISDIQKVHRPKTGVSLDLSEEELDQTVDIELTETETMWMFDSIGSFVASDSEEAKAVVESNERYTEYKKKAGESRDWLNDRYSQTLHGRDKHKECQVSAVETMSIGCSVTESNIHDTFEELKVREGRATSTRANVEYRKLEEVGTNPTKIFPDTMVEADAEKGKIWSGSLQASDIVFQENYEAFEDIAKSEVFKSSLRFTERLVVHSDPVYAQGQKSFVGQANSSSDTGSAKIIDREDAGENGIEGAGEAVQTKSGDANNDGEATIEKEVANETNEKHEEEVKKELLAGPHIKTLWAYSFSQTKGRSVMCMDWNKGDPDILVAGYGSVGESGDGLVCCWTYKNPKFPERIYKLPSEVYSVAFSTQWPGLLAVGLLNGDIYIFDVHTTDLNPTCTSQPLDLASKHDSAVSGLQWVSRQQGTIKEEVLVSTSVSGRILRWTLARKGLQSSELMQIKRTQGKSKAVTTKLSHAAFVAMQGACMSLEFCPEDPILYLVGTEDGVIHKCSCSYTEQTLKDYYGHSGPVYAIETSPYDSNVFLTCSADWSVRIWEKDSAESVKMLQHQPKAFMDCSWSPHRSTVFAAVGDGGLSIWDLSIKDLDPVISINTENLGQKLTTVLFSSNTNTEAIAFGNNDGAISVGMVLDLPTAKSDKQSLVDALSKKHVTD